MRRSALRAAVTLGLFLLALAAGFVLSSQLGHRWIQEEFEQQLGELLMGDVSIERVGLRVRTGLELHGVGVRVGYPAPDLEAITAKRVVTRLKTTSLLLGRFRVGALEIDGLDVHLRRNAAGEWSPPWFPSRAELEEEQAAAAGDLEHELGWMNVLIEFGHSVLREQEIADHIELTNAVITLDDSHPRRDSKVPTHHRFENIQASLDRGSLSDSSDFNLSAHWVAPKAPRAKLEISGRQRDEEDLHLTVAFSDLELASLHSYIVSPRVGGELAGRMTGVVVVTSPSVGRGRIELDWSIDSVEAQIPFGDTLLAFTSPTTSARALFALEPNWLRIEEFKTDGRSIDFDLSGSISRPLGRNSQTSLRAGLNGASREDLERIADGLPDSDAAPFRTLLGRLRSGRIPTVGIRGAAALRTWLAIAGGELAALPPSIRLSAKIEDVTIGTTESDTLSDVSGNVEWNGARFELRDFQSQFNGEPMPRLDFTLDGLSTLLGVAPEAERSTRRARVLPGLKTLWALIRTDEEDGEDHPPSPIRVTLHELHHSALRWPLRDAVFEIDPGKRNLTIAITHGHWAGAPVRGEAELFAGEEQRLSIAIRVAEAVPTDAHADETAVYPGVETDTTWASGRFSTTHMHTGPLEFEQLDAHFSLKGQDLVLGSIDGRLVGGGTMSGEGTFSLARVEDVASSANLRIRGAEADRVAQIFGIEPGFATGRADLVVDLHGELRVETRIIDELRGSISLEASDGEVQQSVPLVSAIAHAIEGWSATAANQSLQYERIDAHFIFEEGKISTDRFALDGPLRMVASGSVHLDADPDSISGTLGVFLLRQAHQLLGNIPLVNLLVPGSDRGLIGAYFEISGPVAKPKLSAMPMRSITGGMPLPDVLRQPFEALVDLFPDLGSSGTKSPKPKPAEPNELPSPAPKGDAP